MPNLISKDEDLLRSAPVIGYEILRLIEKTPEGRISIFDAAEKLKKSTNASARSLYYGMLFLFSLDIIDFEKPYLIANAKN